LIYSWASALEREVRIGEPRDEVLAWIARRLPGRKVFDPNGKEVYVVADVDQQPLDPVCNRWTVAIEIALDQDDRVVGRRVTSSGNCL
jgi:hypothetical protein